MYLFSPDRNDILFIFPLKIKRFSEEQEPSNQKCQIFLLLKITKLWIIKKQAVSGCETACSILLFCFIKLRFS